MRNSKQVVQSGGSIHRWWKWSGVAEPGRAARDQSKTDRHLEGEPDCENLRERAEFCCVAHVDLVF